MIRTATVHEAAQARALGTATIIDVRSSEEFASGHIEGALFLPLHVVPLRLSELERSGTYLVVCQSGGRSAQAGTYLAQHGFDVRSVDGGMNAWRSAGLPVATGLHATAQR